MASGELSDLDFDATPLHKAHPQFVNKLKQILQSSARLMITTGWRELAVDMGVEAQKLHGWEREADPVAEFINYVVFASPCLTVGQLEWHARNINNLKIVDAFRETKEALRQGRLGDFDQPVSRVLASAGMLHGWGYVLTRAACKFPRLTRQRGEFAYFCMMSCNA